MTDIEERKLFYDIADTPFDPSALAPTGWSGDEVKTFLKDARGLTWTEKRAEAYIKKHKDEIQEAMMKAGIRVLLKYLPKN